jgi:predicted RNA polymerase sigma factor
LNAATAKKLVVGRSWVRISRRYPRLCTHAGTRLIVRLSRVTVRGDLLTKLGRHTEAIAEFEREASLSGNERVGAVALACAATAAATI